MNTRNLGRALTILAHAEAREIFMHADVAAFGAPSECHGLVSRGEARRLRQARRQARGVAGYKSFRLLRQAAERQGGIVPLSGQPRWQRFVGRVYESTYPF